MLIEKKIREIIRNNPLPNKEWESIMERWMIYLAEEIVEGIESSHKELTTKEDIRKVIELSDKRFEALQKESNAIRQEMNVRFEALQKEMNVRFEAINSRFESLEKRLGFMQWLIGGGVLLIFLKLFFPHIFPH